MRALIALLAAALFAAPAMAREIVADLSDHEIAITAGFDGAELLLFGHSEQADDVIVIVRGPETATTVRRKERVAGIWINGAEVSFPSAPGFYFVGVTDGLAKAGALETILSETGLGARYLGLATENPETSSLRAEEFRAALIELRARQRLFATTPGRIQMQDGGLFRTKVPFPAATPIGEYVVSVYHIQDGWPVEGVSTPLQVKKAGFGAWLYKFAHDHPPAYGVIAILVAGFAGWLGGVAFRRG